MTPTLSKEAFKVQILEQQGRLHLLQRRAQERGRSVILLFEGWDAAGKGGAIRRVTSALDPRCYRVVPIAAPTDEERARHYLWRFWRHLSRAGRVTIFDRSWYGRVLVERVDGLVPGSGMEPGLRRDRGVRRGAHRPRHRARQVLAAHHQGRAAAAVRGARQVALQELEADRRRLAQSREVGRATSWPSTTWWRARAPGTRPGT